MGVDAEEGVGIHGVSWRFRRPGFCRAGGQTGQRGRGRRRRGGPVAGPKVDGRGAIWSSGRRFNPLAPSSGKRQCPRPHPCPSPTPAACCSREIPQPFEIINKDGAGRVILIADHAGRAFPKSLGTLGLSQARAGPPYRLGHRHRATWRGAWPRALDAPAAARRLFAAGDRLQPATSTIRPRSPQESDGVRVPGNRGLTPGIAGARADGDLPALSRGASPQVIEGASAAAGRIPASSRCTPSRR